MLGKYYFVVDGYPNMKGYLASFKGQQYRYHLHDFRRLSQPSVGYHEVFNFTLASLINVIERTFGVWKNKWRILLDMPSYKFQTQCKIVVAILTFHTSIRKYAIAYVDFYKGMNITITCPYWKKMTKKSREMEMIVHYGMVEF